MRMLLIQSLMIVFTHQRACLVTVMAAIALCCGCGFSIERVKPPVDESRDVERYESPQDCYDAMTLAASRDDFEAALDCMTLETQQQLGGSLLYLGQLRRVAEMNAMFSGNKRNAGTKAAIAGINEVFKTHDIDATVLDNLPPFTPQTLSDTKAMQQLGKRVKKLHSFTSSMLTLLAKLNPGKAPLEVLDGELEIDSIEEDFAKGTITAANTSEKVEFRRIGGGWQIVLQLGSLAPKQTKKKVPSKSPRPDSFNSLP